MGACIARDTQSRLGTRWAAIAREIPGRTEHAVKGRFKVKQIHHFSPCVHMVFQFESHSLFYAVCFKGRFKMPNSTYTHFILFFRGVFLLLWARRPHCTHGSKRVALHWFRLRQNPARPFDCVVFSPLTARSCRFLSRVLPCAACVPTPDVLHFELVEDLFWSMSGLRRR